MSQTPTNRISFLDSSRGLAALVVLLAHFKLAVVPFLNDTWLLKTPLGLLFDAEAAVLYFFLLSGYVLTLSLEKSESLTRNVYWSFILKRIFRIYPAFIFTLLLTFLILKHFNHSSNAWLSSFWIDTTYDVPSILKQMFLIKRIPNDPLLRILPHDWTLSIEMAVSLLLPILAFASRINSVIALLLVYFSVKFLGLDPFAFDFSLGIFLALNRNRWKYISKSNKIILGITSLLLICTDYLAPGIMKIADHLLIHHKSWGLLIILTIILSGKRIQNLLLIKPLVFLGKISYSLYLLHICILLIINYLFVGINSIAFLIIYISSTVLLSAFSYYLIEKPFIKAGHILADKRT